MDARLLDELPDLPRWTEARGMLIARRGRVHARDRAAGAAILVMHDGSMAVLTGTMPRAAIMGARALLRPDAPWLVHADDTAAHAILREVIDAEADERATIYALPPGVVDRIGTSHDADVRWLMSAEAVGWAHVPDDLRREVTAAFAVSPVAAAFADSVPVSFCYASFQTESLWDVSIDTIPRVRRQGHAREAAAFLIAHMRARGYRPVWGAVESNAASHALARSLGFEPVDALRVVTPRTRPGQR